MRLTFVCAAILLAHFIIVQNAVSDDATAEQSALEFQSARFKAMVEEDVETLERFLADDLTYSHTTGWTETKS